MVGDTHLGGDDFDKVRTFHGLTSPGDLFFFNNGRLTTSLFISRKSCGKLKCGGSWNQHDPLDIYAEECCDEGPNYRV
uniref:Uncharacterized protein n=1 Tax=Tanacetum cinerariifolium TaxID=118510 RepID=A0A6L2N4L3_TANCI|nr:hypothetical protein [Tanacetum cinerariifolium]